MRVLEHRRHSRRDVGSAHLNPGGEELARRVGGTLGPFDRVIASPKPRALETVAAMGFLVDAEIVDLGAMPEEIGLAVEPLRLRTFADFEAAAARGDVVAGYARSQETLWRTELALVPDGGRLLAISHGGVIEFGAVAALPSRAKAWGRSLGYLEGIRLYLEGNRWIRGEVLRVEP